MRYAKGTTTVAGINFAIYADITKRGMVAVNETTGEEKSSSAADMPPKT